MRWTCRCTKEACKTRRSLARHPSEYFIPPKCPGCGGRKWRWDRWQQAARRRGICQCGGYHFLHRVGSKWCEHARATVTPAEAADRWGGEALDYHFADDPRLKFEMCGDEPTF